MHFASNWYGGRKIYREGPWEWQKPYSFTVTHAPILIGLYNGNPTARGLVTGVIDGWMAHGKQDAQGRWTYPNEINWRTDAERVGDRGGLTTSLQSAWAAWRWTGDDKYLRPLVGRVGESGPGVLAEINDNAVTMLDHQKDWGRSLAAKPASPFEQYSAWQASGDKAWLEQLHATAIQSKSQAMYMLTEGHWWSDRVEQPSEILQRERLGGVALRRNQTWPGNAVSWRFDDPEAATQVAILVPGATPDRVRVVAYNMSDRPVHARMTGGDVAAGQWRMTSGLDTDGDDKADVPVTERSVAFERSASVDVEFAPRRTSVIELALVQRGTPVEQRADLGIGEDDVTVKGRQMQIVVHSLGAAPTPAGQVRVVDGQGRTLASAPVGSLPAPVDLQRKTATVRLSLPAGFRSAGASVVVEPNGGVPEITRVNNAVTLK
jgi:hypothetical protein